MHITEADAFDRDEMFALYDSAGWNGYTDDADRLCRALANSHVVLTARDDSGTLLGLARTISDDEAICYVQDVLVRPDAQRQGVGRALMERLAERYAHCRFFLLSTDHESTPEGPRNHAFCRSLGFLTYEEKLLTGFSLPRPRT